MQFHTSYHLSKSRDVSSKNPVDRPKTSAKFYFSHQDSLPIKRNQQFVPPANRLSKVRASPYQPCHSPTSCQSLRRAYFGTEIDLPLDLRPTLSLHDCLHIPQIRHDTQIFKREALTLPLYFSFIQLLTKPLRLLVRYLRCGR